MDERDMEHLLEYIEWRKGVEFHHEDEWDEIEQREDVFLDSCASYSVLCNNVEDFVSFAARLDDQSVLEMSNIILVVWQSEGDDEDCEAWERYMAEDDLWEDRQMYSMEYNPCMTPDKRIYLKKSKNLKRSRQSIILNPKLDVLFPSIFMYGRGLAHSKISEQIRNCCHFFPVNVKGGVVRRMDGSC